MKSIKFTSTDPNQKLFGAAVRKNVNAYFQERKISSKGNGLMYFKAITMLGIYIAPFIIILTVTTNIWLSLLMVVLMGIGEAGVGMSVMHDAAHGAFSNKKWVNNLFASTMYIMGSNTFNWHVQHNILHHTFTNIHGYDPDIESKAMIRLNPYTPQKKYHKWQHIYAYFFYGLMTLSKLGSDFGQLLAYNREGVTREQNRKPGLEILKLIFTKLLYFSIIIGLPILFSGYSWWKVLIGFCILHLVAGMIMSTVFQMAHVVEGVIQPLPDSDGVIHNEWAVHQLNTTSDFERKSHFLNWYVGGLNFQIEHHLFPNICHIHYKKISPIIEKTAKEFGLNYNIKPSFSSSFASHYRKLKTLGKQQEPTGEVQIA